jgi:hypothetical protein
MVALKATRPEIAAALGISETALAAKFQIELIAP